jgi:regulator of protease activity HflC (stomatin/prohibitin superfamily)
MFSVAIETGNVTSGHVRLKGNFRGQSCFNRPIPVCGRVDLWGKRGSVLCLAYTMSEGVRLLSSTPHLFFHRRLALMTGIAVGTPLLSVVLWNMLSGPLPAILLAWVVPMLWFTVLAVHSWLWSHSAIGEARFQEYEAARIARAGRALTGVDKSLVYAPPGWHESYTRPGQQVMLLLGALLGFGLVWQAWRSDSTLRLVSPDELRLFLIVSVTLAVGHGFLAAYLSALAKPVESGTPADPGPVPLEAPLRMLVGFHVVLILVFAARLFGGLDYGNLGLSIVLGGMVPLLAETVFNSVAGFFRGGEPRPLGRSVLVEAVVAWRHPVDVATERMEDALGIRLDRSWMREFLRDRLGWILLGGLAAGWASTALTLVPADSSGVAVRMGRFAEQPLGPGLHASLPWPFGGVVVVQTARIHETQIGFDDDLGGAILWTRKHFENERTVLVGDGAELLTINVPIQFRVRDALLSVRRTGDPTVLVRSLAETNLMTLAVTREGESMMLSERVGLAAKLKEAVQRDLDALQSGIELTWIGFKDIHPPVEVTPAYQEVVSALDEKETTVLGARTDRAILLPAAREQAHRIRVEAATSASVRRLTAEAENAPVIALAVIGEDDLAGWRIVRRMELLDTVLPHAGSIVVAPFGKGAEAPMLDLRGGTPYP